MKRVMKLYFLRHAEAEDGTDDAARRLTDHGHAQARDIGRFLRRAAIVFDAAFTSPLERARETAQDVVAITNRKPPLPLQTTEALLNDWSPERFSRWLKDLLETQRALLVGHDPSMSERVRWLLGMKRLASLKMPKGGLACLDTDDGESASLKFFVTPKSLESH